MKFLRARNMEDKHSCVEVAQRIGGDALSTVQGAEDLAGGGTKRGERVGRADADVVVKHQEQTTS
ncbi:hypothetical protein [Streptomyces avermitilis]|uniref:hypothetical protein n=1 Tax=Streptomyces avermitilis TaxID=33903 RepID=UPI0036B77A94